MDFQLHLHLQIQPWRPLHLFFFFFFFLSVFPISYSQLSPPQNIETFYPPPLISPPPSSLTPSSSLDQPHPSSSASTKTIATAVAVTAVGVALISTLFFFLIQRYLIRRKRKTEEANSGPGSAPVSQPAVAHSEFSRLDGNFKGFIVDEDGLDVIYWKRLEKKKSKNSFDQGDIEANVKGNRSKKSEPVQEIPLLRGKSSSSHVQIAPGENSSRITSAPPPPPPPQINHPPSFTGNSVQAVGKPSSSSNQVPPSQSLMAVPNNKSSVPPPPIPVKTNSRPPPPPPIPAKTNSRPPPPPPIPAKTNSAAPPPPPIPGKANPGAPPPPPKAGSSKLPLRPAPPKGGKSTGESSSSADNGQIKMKPLHWDKVNTANADHSMVWDKMSAGSFKFDGDLMEALFGSVAANRKSPLSEANSSANAVGRNSGPSQTFILEPKKSQNIAIVVKSLTIPRNEILDALEEGQGLETEILEKLTRIALSQEEISQILAFKGDPQKLADAESFLFPLLKSVPSAFTRFNAMLFRLNFSSEILHLKESLQTLESSCKELRTRGLFLKLLEAILKAGNRLNAGTARGNARAFNLTSLRKLSDVRSTDGKTTLLHFVVQEVIRAEGKRCVLNRNKSLSRNISHGGDNSFIENSTSKEDRVKEYMMLGLPVVGGLSAEFSNVKKAATIDYETFANVGLSLTRRAAEVQQLLSQIGNNGGGFAKEMKGFLEAAEEELKVAREEQTKVMELVMKTTEYYQAGSSKDKEASRLQIFIIVKDFLEMVDRVCVEIARNLQKRRSSAVNLGSGSSPVRSKAIFPNLPENFMSDKSRGSSSESDDEF